MFAEGGVTNGLNLSNFKRGAFAGLKAVDPCLLEFNWRKVCPDGSTTVGLDLFPLMISEFGMNTAVVNYYPTFVPNDYMFSEYAKTLEGGEKMEKW